MSWVGGRLPLRWCLLIALGASAGALFVQQSVDGEAATSRAAGAALAVTSPPPLPPPSLPEAPSPNLPVVGAIPSLPPVISTPIPSPTVPTLTPPVPSLPPVGSTPTISPSPPPGLRTGGTGAGTSGGGLNPSGGSGGGHAPIGGLTIPLTTIVLRTPFDVALAGALAVLPLLVGIWLLLFGRTWNEARRAKDSRIRLMLAHELGIGPRELLSLSTKSLFKLREDAAFDELTGVMRRAAGMSALEREVARARRQKTPLTVAFVDVDGLKQANDTRGHKAGDQLLRDIAKALTGGLRGQDLVLRYGGDEFVCVLPDTIYEAARAKLSRVQTEAAKAGIGFSVGFAQLERSDDVVDLLGRADRELYDAKAHKIDRPVIRPAADRLGHRQASA